MNIKQWSIYALYAFGCIMLVTFLSDIYAFKFGESFIIYVFLIPAIEEGFKYFAARISIDSLLRFVVSFSLMELIIIKSPMIFIELAGKDLMYGAALSLIASVNHFNAFLFYNVFRNRFSLLIIFLISFIHHATYNSIPEFNNEKEFMLISSVIFAFSPIIVFLFLNKLRCNRLR